MREKDDENDEVQDETLEDSEDGELERDENNADNNEDEFDLSDYIDDDEIPAYKLMSRNAGKDEENKSIPIAVSKTFHESLISQLGLQVLDEKEYSIALYIIGSIDDDGYLRR